MPVLIIEAIGPTRNGRVNIFSIYINNALRPGLSFRFFCQVDQKPIYAFQHATAIFIPFCRDRLGTLKLHKNLCFHSDFFRLADPAGC